jgi:hypothetical protein
MRETKTNAELRAQWTEYARKHLVGRTIVAVEYMEDDECRDLDWSEAPVMLTLDNGTKLVPMRDDEGNGAGTISGEDREGQALLFPVLRRW